MFQASLSNDHHLEHVVAPINIAACRPSKYSIPGLQTHEAWMKHVHISKRSTSAHRADVDTNLLLEGLQLAVYRT